MLKEFYNYLGIIVLYFQNQKQFNNGWIPKIMIEDNTLWPSKSIQSFLWIWQNRFPVSFEWTWSMLIAVESEWTWHNHSTMWSESCKNQFLIW